jgi:hypothetical protein
MALNFSVAEIRQQSREYLASCGKSIVTADDVAYSFPERVGMRKHHPDFKVWAKVKQQVGIYFRTDEMLEQWEQYSPKSLGAPKAWIRRTNPIQPSERLIERKGTGTVTIDMRLMGKINKFHSTWIWDYGMEPWSERLIRYREAYSGLVVVENGGFPVVKDCLTTEG